MDADEIAEKYPKSAILMALRIQEHNKKEAGNKLISDAKLRLK